MISVAHSTSSHSDSKKYKTLSSRFSRVSERQPLFVKSLFLASFISALTVMSTWNHLPHFSSDSSYYKEMAEGHYSNVIKPFSNRILHPMLVRTLAGIFSISTDRAFFAWGLLALMTLAWTLSLILGRSDIPHYTVVSAVVVFTPLWLSLFRDYFLPDLFHAALLGLFFLVLLESEIKQKFRWASLVLLFLLYLTRESTILLTLSIIVVSVYKSERRLAFAACISTLIGISVVSIAARHSPANIHAMNDLLYAGLKIPFNFMKNVLGIQLWTNTLMNNQETYCRPVMAINVPTWLPLGSINSLGVCSFDPRFPINTVKVALTVFGVMPTLLIAKIVKVRNAISRNSPTWLLVVLLYGSLAYFIGTSIGASVNRLIGYGWPAFWLATPILLKNEFMNRSLLQKLLFCHLLVCWIPLVVGDLQTHGLVVSILLLTVVLVLQWFALQSLFKGLRQPGLRY